PAGASLEVLTNLLLPETEGVCTIKMQELTKTAVGRAMFDSAGSFRAEALQRKLGFSVNDVDIVVLGWNFGQNWSVNIVHTAAPVNLDAVKAALHAKPAEKSGDGLEYFVLEPNPWLDMLGRSVFSMLLLTPSNQVSPRSGPLALCAYDAQTLVFADVKPMQVFAAKKGVFDRKTTEVAAAKENPDGKDATAAETPTGPNNMAGMMGKMGMGNPGGGGPPPGAMGMGNPAGQTKQEETPAGPSGSYLTIDSGLKTMLDRVEAKQPVASLALNQLAAARGGVPVLGV